LSGTSDFQPSPLRLLAVGSSLIAAAALFVWLGIEALRESVALLDVLGIVTIVCSIPSVLGGMLILSFGLLDSYRSLRGG
jgi:ABC-type proline/glycine betaine transport system permease subunit